MKQKSRRPFVSVLLDERKRSRAIRVEGNENEPLIPPPWATLWGVPSLFPQSTALMSRNWEVTVPAWEISGIEIFLLTSLIQVWNPCKPSRKGSIQDVHLAIHKVTLGRSEVAKTLRISKTVLSLETTFLPNYYGTLKGTHRIHFLGLAIFQRIFHRTCETMGLWATLGTGEHSISSLRENNEIFTSHVAISDPKTENPTIEKAAELREAKYFTQKALYFMTFY